MNLLLRYTVPRSGGMQKELLFEERRLKSKVLFAPLFVNSIAERNELLMFLTDKSAPASLLVRRTTRIGIPVARPQMSHPGPQVLQFYEAPGSLTSIRVRRARRVTCGGNR